MQRYTLGDYKSVYRDPGSVPINTQLRQQFAQAFAADDALAAAVDQMQAADFAGDQELKKQIEERTRAQLESRASKGNYESMGMDVTKSARGFAKDYQPLTQNLAKVKAYQEKIEKDYRDGFIDINTRNAKLAMSTKDYQGLQVNEQGVVDPDSFFKGKQYVEDVDISADFDKRMEGYIAEKYNTSRGGYEKVELPGGAVEYHVQTEKGLEIIDPKKVSRMFQDMIAGPKYQAAIAQQAEVGTYMLDDEAIQSKLVTALDGDPEDPDSKGLRQDLADAKKELEDAKTKKEKAAAEQSIKALEGSISEMESALETPGKTPEEMESIRRNFIQKSYADALIGREQQAALDKFARRNVIKDNYNVRYSEKEMADYNRLQEADLGSGLRLNMDAIETKNPGGYSVSDINTFKKAKVTEQDNAVRKFKEAIYNLDGIDENVDLSGITIDNILSGELPEEFEQFKSLPSYTNAVNTINSARADIKRQDELLQQARKAVGYDADQIEGGLLQQNYTKGFGRDISGEEILSFAKEYYKDPEMTMTDVVELMRSEQIELTKGPLGENLFGDENVLVHPSKLPKANEFTTAFLDKLKGEDRSFARAKSEGLVAGILTNSKKVDEKARGVLNDYIKENANRQISYTAVDTAPGFTKKQRADINKAFNNFFEGETASILDGMNFGYAGMGPDGTSTMAGFREAMSKDERFTADERAAWANGKLSVNNVLFNESAVADDGGITLQIENSEGAISQIYVPQSEFYQSGLQQYFTAPIFRLASEVNKSKNMGLETTTIDLKPTKDGKPLSLEFSFTNDGADNVKIIHGDDDPIYMGTGDPNFQKAIEDYQRLGLLTF